MNHPEMSEIMREEMRRGLHHSSVLTPHQIKERVRKRMLGEQAAIKANKDLCGKKVRKGCTCGAATNIHAIALNCYPWCEGHDEIELFIEPQRDGKYIYYSALGRSPWSGL